MRSWARFASIREWSAEPHDVMMIVLRCTRIQSRLCWQHKPSDAPNDRPTPASPDPDDSFYHSTSVSGPLCPSHTAAFVDYIHPSATAAFASQERALRPSSVHTCAAQGVRLSRTASTALALRSDSSNTIRSMIAVALTRAGRERWPFGHRVSSSRWTIRTLAGAGIQTRKRNGQRPERRMPVFTGHEEADAG